MVHLTQDILRFILGEVADVKLDCLYQTWSYPGWVFHEALTSAKERNYTLVLRQIHWKTPRMKRTGPSISADIENEDDEQDGWYEELRDEEFEVGPGGW